MNQNQSADNDLQTAIDNITNTTNTDPVFSDPVAAPSSVPEGDTGEVGEPVGPFPEAKVGVITPAPEPIAPLESMNIPELNHPNLPPTGAPLAPTVPAPEPTQTPTQELTIPTLSQTAEAPAVNEPTPEPIPDNPNTAQIKKAALRDLVPILDKVTTMDAPQKFKIYKDALTDPDLEDPSILEPAYKTAREIPDETERAEALLSLIESIDKM